MNSLSFSRLQFEWNILFPKSLYKIQKFVWTIYFTMNSLYNEFLLRIHLESTLNPPRNQNLFPICFANSPLINFFHQITMNSLLASRFHLQSIFSTKSLWIHYQLRDFSLNSLSFSRIHCLFQHFTLNSLFYSRNHYECTISFVNSPSAWRFLFEFTIFFANSPWIHFFPRNHYEFIIFFAIAIWMQYLIPGITLNAIFSRNQYEYTIFSRIHYLFRKFTLNPLFFFLKNHYKFESRWIYYLFHFSTVNSPLISRISYEFTIKFAILRSASRFRYEFTIFFANLLSASQFLFEFTIFYANFAIYFENSPWIQRFPPSHYEFTICFAFTINTLSFSRIYYLLREITVNSLFLSRIYY